MAQTLSQTRYFVKKLITLCNADHTILFKFQQHMLQILIKECIERQQR